MYAKLPFAKVMLINRDYDYSSCSFACHSQGGTERGRIEVCTVELFMERHLASAERARIYVTPVTMFCDRC